MWLSSWELYLIWCIYDNNYHECNNLIKCSLCDNMAKTPNRSSSLYDTCTHTTLYSNFGKHFSTDVHIKFGKHMEYLTVHTILRKWNVNITERQYIYYEFKYYVKLKNVINCFNRRDLFWTCSDNNLRQ